MLKDWGYDAPENSNYKEIRDNALDNLQQQMYDECPIKVELKAIFDVISTPQATEAEVLAVMRSQFENKDLEAMTYLWIDCFISDFKNTIEGVIEIWYRQAHVEDDILDPDIENWLREVEVHQCTGREFITEVSGIKFE